MATIEMKNNFFDRNGDFIQRIYKAQQPEAQLTDDMENTQKKSLL